MKLLLTNKTRGILCIPLKQILKLISKTKFEWWVRGFIINYDRIIKSNKGVSFREMKAYRLFSWVRLLNKNMIWLLIRMRLFSQMKLYTVTDKCQIKMNEHSFYLQVIVNFTIISKIIISYFYCKMRKNYNVSIKTKDCRS